MKLNTNKRRLFLSLLIAAILCAVVLAYLQPAFIVDLANRVGFCQSF